MKAGFRLVFRAARTVLALLGLAALFVGAIQFTPLPWRAYARLSEVPSPVQAVPTHILVMGGSGIPGESGLTRIFFGAQAARQYPKAKVLVAMPLDTNKSFASRAYFDELRLRGVPARRIQILSGGRNTREQALRLAEILSRRTTPSHVLIVTDPYHIRRTTACIRKACASQKQKVHLYGQPVFALSIEDSVELVPQNLDAPRPEPAAHNTLPNAGFSLRFRYNLWSNLSCTLDVLREYSALLYYRLRDWI